MKLQSIIKRATVSFIALALGATTAYAEFPERDIEMIFPWPPGVKISSSQVMAEALSKELGVNVTVISTPGGTGTKAMQVCDGFLPQTATRSLMAELRQ